MRHPPKSPLFPHTPLFRSARQQGSPPLLQRGLEKTRPSELFPQVGVQERHDDARQEHGEKQTPLLDRKSTRLNSSHANISYAVFCLKKKKTLLELSSDKYR